MLVPSSLEKERIPTIKPETLKPPTLHCIAHAVVFFGVYGICILLCSVVYGVLEYVQSTPLGGWCVPSNQVVVHTMEPTGYQVGKKPDILAAYAKPFLVTPPINATTCLSQHCRCLPACLLACWCQLVCACCVRLSVSCSGACNLLRAVTYLPCHACKVRSVYLQFRTALYIRASSNLP